MKGHKKLGIDKLRLGVQTIYTILTNGYLYGYLNGKIYQGKLKYACVPGLNCYSCPGAVGNITVPFAVLGFFFIFGSILGRFVCGWLCPFGWVQDLLHKIPLFRKRKKLPYHHILKYLKYVVLVGFVLIGSSFLFTGFAKIPAFCKFLCPSGTLFGAIPLLSTNNALQSQIGGLFFWKLGVLLVILLVSIKVYRPFCQYLCPLGAIYGWFNRFSLVQVQWQQEKCTSCMACKRACPMDLEPEEISVSEECIRCGKCVDACPQDCLHLGNHKADKCEV